MPITPSGWVILIPLMLQVCFVKSLLWHKNYYGLRGNVNDLIRSYLSNRKQFVSINGFVSETRNICCGVLQGSSLGPLLFLIYINDFRFCLQTAEIGHFADDTFIMYNSLKVKTIETVINTELKSLNMAQIK